jgi:hypothetical protein
VLWHDKGRKELNYKKDGKFRHPADATQWGNINTNFLWFDDARSNVMHREFIVTRNLKIIQSSLVRCCCLRNLLGLLGWDQILPGSGSFLMTPSKEALMRVT